MDMDKGHTQQDRYLKVNDLTVYYEESGKGKPLILLHGGGLTSAIWEPHRSILSEQFHVFAPDCRGHGRTNNPLGTLNYRVLADDLAGFIRELKLVRPFICGWSMGARTVLEFGMRYPSEAQALVCCGGGPSLSKVESQEIVQEEKELLQSPKIAEVMRARHSHVYGAGYWKTLVTHLHALLTAGYSEEEYSCVVVPTLVLCGDREERPGIEEYVALFRTLAHGELAVIPNANHFSPTTNVETFTNIIAEFFLRHSDRVEG